MRAGARLDQLERGADGIGSRIGRAAEQRIGLPHRNQHRTEIVALREQRAAVLRGHFPLAELYHLLNHRVHPVIVRRVDDLKPFDVKAALCSCRLDLLHIADQNRRQEPVFFQACGRFQDSCVGALRENNLARVCLQSLNKLA